MQYNIFRKVLTIGIIFLFICMSSISSTGNTVVKKHTIAFSNGITLYVGGSGEGNYTKIQDAIDNASDGDTVFVYNGTYYENVYIEKTINLIGEDKNTTIIDAMGKDSVIRICKINHILVSGFTIQESGNDPDTDAGIRVGRFGTDSNNCEITDNIIKNNQNGINIEWAFGGDIFGNIIMNNRNHGIYINSVSYQYNVSYNIVKDNDDTGILNECDGNHGRNIIFRNIVENNFKGIVTSNDVFENWVRNNNFGIIPSWSASAYRNIVENNNVGIFVEFGTYNIIKNNNLFDNNLHATFEIWIPVFLLPLIFYPYNRWIHNYYEGHSFGPKIIKGTMILFTIVAELEFEFSWRYIDWRPAKEPNDLDFLEEEILSKIKI